MRAIEIVQNTDGTISIRKGESQFKNVDEFWTDFIPDGREKTTAFKANVVKDTEVNQSVALALMQNAADAKLAADTYANQSYKIRNRFEK